MSTETRNYKTRFEEIHAKVDAKAYTPPKIRGYAAVFGKLSENLGGFVEEIAPGAFDTVLKSDVRALWNHNANYIFGRTKSGTLRIWQDATGLGYEVSIPNAQWARDAVESIRRGDVDQSSFGFDVARDEWRKLPDGTPLRRILSIKRLYDVSPVTVPAYPQTSVEARANAEVLKAYREGVQVPESLRQARVRLELAEAEAQIIHRRAGKTR